MKKKLPITFHEALKNFVNRAMGKNMFSELADIELALKKSSADILPLNTLIRNYLFNNDVDLNNFDEDKVNILGKAYNLYKYGEQIFSLDAQLIESLNMHPIKKIDDVSYLKTPFKNIYLRFPMDKTISYFYHEANCELYLDGVYVSVTDNGIVKTEYNFEKVIIFQFDFIFVKSQQLTNDMDSIPEHQCLTINRAVTREGIVKIINKLEAKNITVINNYMEAPGLTPDLIEDSMKEAILTTLKALLYINNNPEMVEKVEAEFEDTSKMKSSSKIIKTERRNAKLSKLPVNYVSLNKELIIDHKFKDEDTTQSDNNRGHKTISNIYKQEWGVRGFVRRLKSGKVAYIKSCIKHRKCIGELKKKVLPRKIFSKEGFIDIVQSKIIYKILKNYGYINEENKPTEKIISEFDKLSLLLNSYSKNVIDYVASVLDKALNGYDVNTYYLAK